LVSYRILHISTYFSCEKPDPKAEVAELVEDAKLHRVIVSPPDLRRKNIDFEIIKDKEIAFGLSHIRGVGHSAIKHIQEIGDVSNFVNFLKAAKKIHRNVAEALIKSAACDFYNISRTMMLKYIYAILGRSENDEIENRPEYKSLTKVEYQFFMQNVDNLGVLGALQEILNQEICIPNRRNTIEAKIKYLEDNVEDTNRSRALWEKLYIGISLTCSAADDFEKDRKAKTCLEIINLPAKSKVSMHVVIDEIKLRRTKKEDREFCYLDVSDNSAKLNIVCWPEVYEKIREDLRENSVCSIAGIKESWNGREQIVAKDLSVID
jgi:DNA polymerase III alpha subunit